MAAEAKKREAEKAAAIDKEREYYAIAVIVESSLVFTHYKYGDRIDTNAGNPIADYSRSGRNDS